MEAAILKNTENNKIENSFYFSNLCITIYIWHMWSLFSLQIINLYGYSIKSVPFIMHNLKNIIIYCEGVASQPHWYTSTQLGISKSSFFNNFLIYDPICMEFVPNSLIL